MRLSSLSASSRLPWAEARSPSETWSEATEFNARTNSVFDAASEGSAFRLFLSLASVSLDIFESPGVVEIEGAGAGVLLPVCSLPPSGLARTHLCTPGAATGSSG